MFRPLSDQATASLTTLGCSRPDGRSSPRARGPIQLMVGIRPLSLAFLMLALLIPASASAEPTTRIIVKRDPGLTPAEQRDIRADAGVRHVENLPLARTEVVT